MWSWLEFPADPERWASPCGSPSHHWLLASSLRCSFISWVLSIGSFFLVIYFLPSYLFLYIHPFLLYTLVCAIFLFFCFWGLGLVSFCYLTLQSRLACFTWCSNPILLMWYHSSAVGWKTFVVWRFMKNQHLWSVWIHAGYNGGMFAQCNCMFHMVIILPKSTALMAKLCRESSVFIHIAKIWAETVVKVGYPTGVSFIVTLFYLL